MALVPARNEGARIGATVRALRGIRTVGRVVVVDDGSTDHTAEAARTAGARVLQAPGTVGKGGALEGALERVTGAVYLLVDGDAGGSAARAEEVLRPVLEGGADLAVAVPPPPPVGGFGLAKRVAEGLVRRASGFTPRAPLSGQRAATAECLRACRPLARGFGVDAALTADAARMGFGVVEVFAPIEHRFTGRDLRGFLHRGRQGFDVLRAMAPRILGIR